MHALTLRFMLRVRAAMAVLSSLHRMHIRPAALLAQLQLDSEQAGAQQGCERAFLPFQSATSASNQVEFCATGAVAAAAVGGGTLASSFRCGATLLAFYFSSSRLTSWMEDRKDTDDAFKAGGQRHWVQARLCACRARSSRAGGLC